MVELYTLDINFDNLDNLNSSVEEVRRILDNFKQDDKIVGYYIMRYHEGDKSYLGVKMIFNNFQDRDKILNEIKQKIKTIEGYKDIDQDKSEGEITDNIPLICSISMEFRNKIWDLLKRKPTDEEFGRLTHYLANPLLLNYDDESRIKNIR